MPESATTFDFSAPDWRSDPGPLAAALIAAPDDGLCIDLSDLNQPSTLHLQVLLAARRSFGESGRALDLVNPPQGFATAVAILGLEADFGPEAG